MKRFMMGLFVLVSALVITFVILQFLLALPARADTGAVYIQGPIEPMVSLNKLMSDVSYTRMNLEVVQGKRLDKLVVVLITPGGSVTEAVAMFQYLRKLAKDNDIQIYTVASGMCASAGMILLQAGDIRYGCDHTYYMTHSPFAMLQRDQSLKREDAVKFIQDIDKTNLDIMQLFAERMGINHVRLYKYFTDAEYVMDASDAYRIGFIDKVIYSAKDTALGSK